jgi:hypothetical protein
LSSSIDTTLSISKSSCVFFDSILIFSSKRLTDQVSTTILKPILGNYSFPATINRISTKYNPIGKKPSSSLISVDFIAGRALRSSTNKAIYIEAPL